MSNQEMQFADPDWKPSQQLDTKTNPQEQEVYNPQPVNADSREQNQWRAAPSAPPQQEGYTGLRPYTGPEPGQMQGGNFRQRPYRRRGRGPWFWIILAIIIIAMTSGGFRSFNGPSFDHNPFNQQQIVGKPIIYTVSGQPTIVINDTNGNVQVNVGSSTTDVVIQAIRESNFFGNPNDIPANISQDANNANIITASVQDGQQGSVDFNVTVPQGANLQLQTDSGNINVNGVNGQMTLNTKSGSIDASNDVMSGTSKISTSSGDISAKSTTLSGQATISTDSGNIGFDGTIGTTGTYQFQTSSGNVDLIVPTTPSFHLNASTSSGSIHSNGFPGVNVQDINSGQKVNGDVGGSSQGQGANVTITTVDGNIDLHQR
jgi:DUF4097 and DUF4098 domain-containing protein YvlB